MTSTTISTASTTALTLKGDDTLTITALGSLKPSGPAVSWNLSTPQGAAGVVVTNDGVIAPTSGRAFDTSGTASAAVSFSLVNDSPGVITGASDVMRMQKTVMGGRLSIDNAGSITAAAGRGFNIQEYAGLASLTLTNHLGATLQSTDDGLRLTTGGAGANTALNTAFTGVVTVDNAGTIKTVGSGSGQALDFHDINAGALGQVKIINETTGVIQAADADGIRGARFTTIDNWGQIAAANFSPASTGNDGIDFQANDGSAVNNHFGGSITGARHGITGDLPVAITNDGTITGQLGSGINLDTASATTTTVVNGGAGVIVGNAGGTSDGDGIDIDGLVSITNHGLIKALGTSAGQLSEAVTIGGGTIDNFSDGSIVSVERAITVDDSNLGNAFAPTIIYNEGLIQGDDGEAISITDTFADTITNKGVINGGISTGDGADVFNLYAGSTTGTIDAGVGSDTINLVGPGSGTLSGVANAEVLSVEGGAWTLLDGETYAGGASIAGGASLQLGSGGTAGALSADVADDGLLILDRSDATSLSGAISGAGVVRQAGAGVASLTGHNSYAGGTDLAGGTLDLAFSDSAGSGPITFEAGDQRLVLEVAASPAFTNTLDGFAAGDSIDLAGIGLATAASLGAQNQLTVTGGSAGPVSLRFDPSQHFSTLHFRLADDGAGGTLVTLATDLPPAYLYRGGVTAAETIDLTGDGKAHSVLVGSGDTTVLTGSGGSSVRLGAGNDTVLGGSGKDTISFGPGLGTVTGGAGPDAFILTKGQIADPAAHAGLYDTVTDFSGAGSAYSSGRDFIWLQGFAKTATLAYEHDLAGDPNAHLYGITDGGYHAEFVLEYAGPGVALSASQFGFL